MMKMNRKIAGLAICLLLLGGVLAVYITQQAEEVKVEVSQELNIALGRGIGGLDPHGSLSGDARIIWRSIYASSKTSLGRGGPFGAVDIASGFSHIIDIHS
ncbi:hypothetical protein M1N88_03220 [Dehalococcoidia bacterium]|nr:hypothetical protein [Dehalococcoidia bacterium]